MATDFPPVTEERARPDAPTRRPDFLLAGMLALMLMSWNNTIGHVFERGKVFLQYDVLFNSDPVVRLQSIETGKGEPEALLVHPGYRVYFSRPIRLVGKCSRGLGLIPDTSRSECNLRHELALMVTPAVSGLTVAAAYVLFTLAGLTRKRALLMALICAVSFSQLVFGGVPDHMPVSSLLVTILLLLTWDMARRPDAPLRAWAWIMVGGLYAGTTITNAAPFVILFAAARWCSGRAFWPAARETLLLTTGVLAVTAGLALAGRVVAGASRWSVGQVQHHASHYHKRDLHLIPEALLESFAPAGLVQIRLPKPLAYWNKNHSGRSIPKRFETSRGAYPWGLPAAFCVVLLTGTLAWWRGGGPGRALAVASLGVTAFHLTLHSFWGDAFFLYSQHWLIPTAFLLAGNLTWPGWAGRACLVALSLAAVGMFFHNGALLNELFTTLAGSS